MLIPIEPPMMRIGNWPIYRTVTFLPSVAILEVISVLLVLVLSPLETLPAIAVGLLLVVIHFGLELIHQYGHKIGADMSGYPSTGLRVWGPLATITYPDDEGDLPSGVHIQRALGGPLASLLAAIPIGIIAAALWSSGTAAQILLGFALFETVAVFGLGALFPAQIPALDFTSDGAILLREMRKN